MSNKKFKVVTPEGKSEMTADEFTQAIQDKFDKPDKPEKPAQLDLVMQVLEDTELDPIIKRICELKKIVNDEEVVAARLELKDKKKEGDAIIKARKYLGNFRTQDNPNQGFTAEKKSKKKQLPDKVKEKIKKIVDENTKFENQTEIKYWEISGD